MLPLHNNLKLDLGDLSSLADAILSPEPENFRIAITKSLHLEDFELEASIKVKPWMPEVSDTLRDAIEEYEQAKSITTKSSLPAPKEEGHPSWKERRPSQDKRRGRGHKERVSVRA